LLPTDSTPSGGSPSGHPPYTGYGQGSGHVFNLGHGITPEVEPEQVRNLVEAVHEQSQPYHLQNT
jgi:hypothetical protein